MNDAIISLDKVTKSYGGVVANHAVSLTVPRGRITGLIGPNGSGKTTLFNSIVGYHPIDSGSIRFEDREISQLRVQEIARLGLLRTFQTTRIYGKMDCMQNMLISTPHRKERYSDMFSHASPEVGERVELVDRNLACDLGRLARDFLDRDGRGDAAVKTLRGRLVARHQFSPR